MIRQGFAVFHAAMHGSKNLSGSAEEGGRRPGESARQLVYAYQTATPLTPALSPAKPGAREILRVTPNKRLHPL